MSPFGVDAAVVTRTSIISPANCPAGIPLVAVECTVPVTLRLYVSHSSIDVATVVPTTSVPEPLRRLDFTCHPVDVHSRSIDCPTASKRYVVGSDPNVSLMVSVPAGVDAATEHSTRFFCPTNVPSPSVYDRVPVTLRSDVSV